MMQATDVTATQSTQNQNNTVTQATPEPEQFSEDYLTFLNLLTAQVQNQDPLQPIDSTQFVDQLATFSMLEQQVVSNDHLADISQTLQYYFQQLGIEAPEVEDAAPEES